MKKILLIVICINVFYSNNLNGQSTDNGYLLPIQGEIKVLIVWAKKTSTFTSQSQVTGYGQSPLPINGNEFFDPMFTPGIEPTGYITKYFYEQSFGQYIVTGDYLENGVEQTAFFHKLLH